MRIVQRYLLVPVLICAVSFSCRAQLSEGSAFDAGASGPMIDSFILANKLPPTLDSSFVIRRIQFEGNKKTRDIILQRELPFKTGDSLKIRDFPRAFAQARKQLMNTMLFHEVIVSVNGFESPFVDIQVFVRERWYLFPIPYFKPVDRNLSQWLFDKGARIDRLDYGIKLMYNNITGNNDNLRFNSVTGYTQQLQLSYHRPFIDKGLKWGMNVDFAFGKTKEVNYNTIGDKQQFLKSGQYLNNFFNGKLAFTYRPRYFTTHTFGFGFNHVRVSDTVLKLNPVYFFNGATQVKYPEFYYRLYYQNLDYIPYPTRGYAGEIFVKKQGLNHLMNLWQITAKGLGNWHLSKEMFYSISVLGSLKIPFHQPFYSMKMLGYGDFFPRGYEYYVVDGVAGGLINATLSRQLTNFSFHIPGTKWLTGRLIPLKIYGKVFGCTGYVYNPRPEDNVLPNTLLGGAGIGLDIFTSYDFTLKLEFSVNRLGQNGLYLQKKSMF